MIGVNFEVEVGGERAREIVGEILADPMGGWAKLPIIVDKDELSRIHDVANEIREKADVLVCIGIGGSYLGHRALIEALGSDKEIIYAGNSLSLRELEKALKAVDGKDFAVNVISKSGTTLEPAIAFEKFKQKLVEKYGEAEAYKRIYATTDASKGTLHDETVANGYTRFVVPDDIGGRYSVLSAVGLLPLAVAGINIDLLIDGAKEIAESLIKIPVGITNDDDATSVVDAENITKNPMIQYAWMRNELWQEL